MLEHLPTLGRVLCPSRSDGAWWALGFVLVGGRATLRHLFLTLVWALGTDSAETGRVAQPSRTVVTPTSIQGQLGLKPPARDRFPSFPQREAVSSRKNRVSVMGGRWLPLPRVWNLWWEWDGGWRHHRD